MLTDIVGTSILTLPGAAAKLGWVPLILLLAGLCPVAIYTASLMARARALLAASKGVEPLSMGDAVMHIYEGKQWLWRLVNCAVYGFAFLGQGAYLLTMGQTLQGWFYMHEACLPGCVAGACVVCWPVIVSVRQLSDSLWLCFVNFFLILAVLGLVMAKMYEEGRADTVETSLFAEGLTAISLLGAATNIVYSYAGHWLYFELMAEMKQPEHFTRVFAFNGPTQIVLYTLIACWGYYFQGKDAKGYLLDNLPLSVTFQWASAILFFHVAIAFLLKNVVLARYFHSVFSPARAEIYLGQEGGCRAHLEFACCATGMLGGAYFVANMVPFFDDMLGLIGGMLSAPISFFLPIALFVGAARAARADDEAAMERASMAHGGEVIGAAPTSVRRVSLETHPLAAGADGAQGASQSRLSDASTASAGAARKLSRGTGDEGPPGGVALRIQDGFQTPLCKYGVRNLDVLLCIGIGLFAFATMVLGTSNVVSDIIQRTQEYGPPFACRSLVHR